MTSGFVFEVGGRLSYKNVSFCLSLINHIKKNSSIHSYRKFFGPTREHDPWYIGDAYIKAHYSILSAKKIKKIIIHILPKELFIISFFNFYVVSIL